MSVKAATKPSLKTINDLSRPLVYKSAEFLEIREYVAFARASKMLNSDLLKHSSSAQLFKGCAIREYPLLARDLPFLLAQECPDMPEKERRDLSSMDAVRKVVLLFRKIDAYTQMGFFLPTRVRTNPYEHQHPQRIAFHDSAMFQIVNRDIFQRVDIRDVENPSMVPQRKDFTRKVSFFWDFPNCRGSGAMTANDKFVAINRITKEPNVKNPTKGNKPSKGSSTVVFFDSTTGHYAGRLHYSPAVSSLCFDPNGELVTGDYRSGVSRVKFTSKNPTAEKSEGSSAAVPEIVREKEDIIMKHFPQPIAITALAATPNEILIGDERGKVVRYNCKTESRTTVKVDAHSNAINKIVVNPSGELMVLSSEERNLSQVNRASETALVLSSLHNDSTRVDSTKAFCHSDKRMFRVVDGKLRVSRPFDFTVSRPFDFTTKSSLAEAPDLMPRRFNRAVPLHCDGARLIHHFTHDTRVPQAGTEIRIYDFSVDARRILTSLKENHERDPDSYTNKKYYEDFKARFEDHKDAGDGKTN